MAIAKVIEVIAEGATLEAAVQSAVTETAKTLRNIRSVYVESFQALVSDDQVKAYRVNAKVTFVVD